MTTLSPLAFAAQLVYGCFDTPLPQVITATANVISVSACSLSGRHLCSFLPLSAGLGSAFLATPALIDTCVVLVDHQSIWSARAAGSAMPHEMVADALSLPITRQRQHSISLGNWGWSSHKIPAARTNRMVLRAVWSPRRGGPPRGRLSGWQGGCKACQSCLRITSSWWLAWNLSNHCGFVGDSNGAQLFEVGVV